MQDIFDRDFQDILASELVSVTGGLVTGTVMAAQESLILAVPGLLIIFRAS